MATDHFERHKREIPTDWNFNILCNAIPAIKNLAKQYAVALNHTGLYNPIPEPWLHITVLRVGSTSEYTKEEMIQVADHLALKLQTVQLPEFFLDSWWLWGGNVVLHMSPDDQFSKIYSALRESLREVVGDSRTPKYGGFIPHITLAYTRTHNQEFEIAKQLASVSPKPATFNIKEISLIKQWPTEGHYQWEVVKHVPIDLRL
jgi:2'-5' RNA ligase